MPHHRKPITKQSEPSAHDGLDNDTRSSEQKAYDTQRGAWGRQLVMRIAEQNRQERFRQTLEKHIQVQREHNEILKASQTPTPPVTEAVASSEPDLTVKEVAAHLRVSEKTIYRRLQAKTLKGYQIPGGQWRIPQSELDRFRKGT
jgi:excisionase family DNA binding protein